MTTTTWNIACSIPKCECRVGIVVVTNDAAITSIAIRDTLSDAARALGFTVTDDGTTNRVLWYCTKHRDKNPLAESL